MANDVSIMNHLVFITKFMVGPLKKSSVLNDYDNRFLGLTKPGGTSFFTKRQASIQIAAIWIGASILNMPLAIWGHIIYLPSTSMHYCKLSHGVADSFSISIFLLSARAVAYFCPLLFVWTGNVGIALRTKNSLSQVVFWF